MRFVLLATAAMGIWLLLCRDVTALADGNETPVSSEYTGVVKAADSTGVHGHVQTPSGNPVVDASILVKSLDQPAPAVPEMAMITDSNGNFNWPLPRGKWQVTVISLSGKRVSKNVTVGRSGPAKVNFILSP